MCGGGGGEQYRTLCFETYILFVVRVITRLLTNAVWFSFDLGQVGRGEKMTRRSGPWRRKG